MPITFVTPSIWMQMASVINTNTLSLNSQRNLAKSQATLATSLQRLSSGLRINSAKDDAAGLAISDRMTSQIRGLNQAARNTNDGISLAQTAEGALSQTGNLLQRMRELSIQSANATNSSSDRASLQAEVNQLKQEVNRLSSTTEFNGLKLLDGSFTSKDFQVGANANQTINVSIEGSSTNDLHGDYRLIAANSNRHGGTRGAFFNTTANHIGAQTLTINGHLGTVSDIDVPEGVTAYDIAKSIDARESDTGVSATAETKILLTSSSSGVTSFELHATPDGITKIITASTEDWRDGDQSALVAAINKSSSETGVNAIVTEDNRIELIQADGKDIIIDNFKHTSGTLSLGYYDDTVSTGVIGLGFQLGESSPYNKMRAVGSVILDSPRAFSASNSDPISLGNVFEYRQTQTAETKTLSTVDISSSEGAQVAIDVLDASLAQISSFRSNLGAIQNRFEATITSLQTTSENLSAARSRILDADFATETANLTKAQILQQSGVAMLAQANQIPQNILSLLG